LRTSEKTAVQHVRLVPYLLCNEQPLAPLELESALSQFRLQNFLKYQHLLVMPFCRRNLADIIDKEWVTLESNQFLNKKQLIVALIKSVKYMHDAGYVHGDLKPRHFVRYNDDYALINLHASAKIGCSASWRKASTAYLPPEAIRYLDAHPVPDDHAAVCRCGDTFDSVPEVESVTVVNSKATLKFRSKHPFSQGQDVRLSGFVPETTSGGVIINNSFHISDCTEHSIEFSICDVAFGSVGVYDCQAVGGVAFNCLGLCGLAHSAHDMWALGVMIFR
jgi:serine/threonine protein kinase